MYSVVLMTALTVGGAEAPECHLFRGGHGCHGYAGCYGGGYGCYGGGHGCYGGGWGCYGGGWGCYGGGYGYGCYGGGYGCYGGGWGCYGGGYGYNCHGCYGSAYNCYGCYGGCYGVGYTPYHSTPAVQYGAPVQAAPVQQAVPVEKSSSTKPARSNLVVELPENAKLYVDGQLMKSTSAKRTFVTPELDANQTYFYDLKAEFERNGQTVNVTGRVTIQPGQDVVASLTEANNGTFLVSAR